jgi:hypothetical protein
MTQEATQVTPANIMQIGLGFWGSKTLLSAIKLGLFSELAAGPLEGGELSRRLGLHDASSEAVAKRPDTVRTGYQARPAPWWHKRTL